MVDFVNYEWWGWWKANNSPVPVVFAGRLALQCTIFLPEKKLPGDEVAKGDVLLRLRRIKGWHDPDFVHQMLA